MAEIGKRNVLKVLREAPPGVYVDAGNLGEILVPVRYVPPGTKPGDALDVFVHYDSDDRLVATMETPKAIVGEFACLEVVGLRRGLGAFLDWGLTKDLFLPTGEQEDRVQLGDWVIVHIHLDSQTQRIVASSYIDRYLDKTEPKYASDHPVELLIIRETPLGYAAIVNHAHSGLLYRNELTSPLGFGAKVPGYVRAVRPDGKIDLRLDSSGYERVGGITRRVLEELQKNNGRIEYDDQSSPEAIRAAFNTSKKAFKQAIGALYREGKIRFADQGIELVPDGAKAPRQKA